MEHEVSSSIIHPGPIQDHKKRTEPKSPPSSKSELKSEKNLVNDKEDPE